MEHRASLLFFFSLILLSLSEYNVEWGTLLPVLHKRFCFNWFQPGLRQPYVWYQSRQIKKGQCYFYGAFPFLCTQVSGIYCYRGKKRKCVELRSQLNIYNASVTRNGLGGYPTKKKQYSRQHHHHHSSSTLIFLVTWTTAPVVPYFIFLEKPRESFLCRILLSLVCLLGRTKRYLMICTGGM